MLPEVSTTILNQMWRCVSIERTITRERLTRYLGAAGHDRSKALELYEYNVQLSEVLYGRLHGLEVMVRNAAHHALTASYGRPDWYDTAPLSPYWQDQLANREIRHSSTAKSYSFAAQPALASGTDTDGRQWRL